MKKPPRIVFTERIYVYCPRGLKAQLLDLVGREESRLSAYVVHLIRTAIREAKKI